MRFPGKRKSKHYFPVSERGRIPLGHQFQKKSKAYLIGIDQLLVDIEVNVSEEFLQECELIKGQSIILETPQAERILQKIKEQGLSAIPYAGGAIGNTLHNYSILSDQESILLGVISQNITVGDQAYRYLCNTSSLVDLSYLYGCDGPMGMALCFVTPDGERSFGICKGKANELPVEAINEELFQQEGLLLISAYLLRDPQAPIYASTMKSLELAKKKNMPVVLSLGTSGLIAENPSFWQEFIRQHVNVLAMNQEEAYALSGINDPLLAGEFALDFADLVLITVGPDGLYLCGHVERSLARETKDILHSKSIPHYNKYEYSRAMMKNHCQDLVKIYNHINPYMGGPGEITNTNGAGDAALAALLHDMTANIYHREALPMSPKHLSSFLTYSSLSQISKYANRVSYEVLKQKSPRLLRGLPEKEDSLEESYWEK